jgi:glycolate oxidase FAD binding subunit
MRGSKVTPKSEAAVAETLRAASEAGRSVVVQGGGTKAGWGRAGAGADVRLSTAKLDALVTHEAGDLICVAQAGMRLADLQAALALDAEHRQRLMLDPPHGAAQTLGGIVAANASGPLRTRYGAPRDLVIGARFVLSDGTVARTGGRVVKNVAGYDLAKLLCGSLGTLAVVTEVAFRLHPLADAARTVALDDATPEAVAAFAQALSTAPVVPAACEAVWPDGALLVRVESSEDGAERQAALAAGLAPGARVLAADEADARWAAHATRPWGGGGVVAAIGVPPARLGDLLALADRHGAEAVVRAHVGVGELRLDDDPERVRALRADVEALGGHAALRRSTPATDALVWPDLDPVAEELMRAVKRQLDPTGTLAPGRHAHEAAA